MGRGARTRRVALLPCCRCFVILVCAVAVLLLLLGSGVTLLTFAVLVIPWWPEAATILTRMRAVRELRLLIMARWQVTVALRVPAFVLEQCPPVTEASRNRVWAGRRSVSVTCQVFEGPALEILMV